MLRQARRLALTDIEIATWRGIPARHEWFRTLRDSEIRRLEILRADLHRWLDEAQR